MVNLLLHADKNTLSLLEPLADNEKLVVGTVGVSATFTLSEEWDDYTVVVKIRNNATSMRIGDVPFEIPMPIGNVLTIPPQAMERSGELYIGLYGIKADCVTPTTWCNCGKIIQGAAVAGQTPAPPPPTVYDEIIADVENAVTLAQQALDAVVGMGVNDRHYTFEQAVAADTWTITHGLGKNPAVSVVDTAGNIIWCQAQYTDLNTVVLQFSAPFAGAAYCN